MKKLFFIVVGFSFMMACRTRTMEDITGKQPDPGITTNYEDDVKVIIQNNCNNCHAPGGSKSSFPLNTYQLMKENFDEILNRVQRPNGDPLKMPQGSSLSSSQIEVLKKWKADGFIEK
ncbi:MAG TPA: hypothetical protein PKX92_03135 [Edaphocola sp.]|nr:hypothetical protein [Edaphocola sp.]